MERPGRVDGTTLPTGAGTTWRESDFFVITCLGDRGYRGHFHGRQTSYRESIMDARRSGRGEWRQFRVQYSARSYAQRSGLRPIRAFPRRHLRPAGVRLLAHLLSAVGAPVRRERWGARGAAGQHDPPRRGSEHRLGRGNGTWRHTFEGPRSMATGVPLLLVLAGAGDVAAMPACRFPLPCGGARRWYLICRTGAADCGSGMVRPGHAFLYTLCDVGDFRDRRRGASVEGATCLAGFLPNTAIGPGILLSRKVVTRHLSAPHPPSSAVSLDAL